MKRIVINVKENKYRFFMELIQSLDFIQVQQEADDSKEDITTNLINGFKDLKRYKDGALKTTPAKDFLNEL